ncbi:MAG: hypothetical protein HY785_11685 [Oscillatoriophycideae cyanobacterium NC_groundwater_1537_Pr4_S-0.65um_50_18]|nr:hypothetical protein [Oscillatoriophycideae cyanobacterium NC_groundwater_1537_Pr4_S-0.65um_50_18]
MCDRPIELKSDRPMKVGVPSSVHEVLRSKVKVSCSDVGEWRSPLKVPSIEVGIPNSEAHVSSSEVGEWRSHLEVPGFEGGGWRSPFSPKAIASSSSIDPTAYQPLQFHSTSHENSNKALDG